MRHTLLITTCLIYSYACSGQNKLFGKDSKLNSYSEEKITLVNISQSGNNESAALITSLAPAVIKSGIGITKNILAAKEAKFSTEYSATYTSSEFYLADFTTNLQNLKLLRTYGSKPDIGLEADFLCHLNSDKNGFNIELENLLLNYTKAKANSKDPIDLQFEISFNALVTKDGKSEFSEVAKNAIEVRGVKLGKKYSAIDDHKSNWFPIPKFSLNVKVTNTDKITKDAALLEAAKLGSSIDNLVSQGWIVDGNKKAIKYIKIDDSNYYRIKGDYQAGGSYSISIKVKEANPRKIKSQNLAKFFEDNSESITSVTDAAIGFFFKEDEEESEE